MTHDCMTGFWKVFYEGLAERMEKFGCSFMTFEEMMEEEGEDAPWEDFYFTPEEYYYNFVLGQDVISAYQEDLDNFMDAASFAAEFAFGPSAYAVKGDEDARTISVCEKEQEIIRVCIHDVEAIEVVMPDHVYKAVKVYPEVIGSAKVSKGTATIAEECLDNVFQIFMVVAGRAEELMDSCEEE